MQNQVIGDKELKNLYQTHQNVGVKKSDDKWQKKFCNFNYRCWGFIVYPIFKNTRLLSIIKAILGKFLIKTKIEYSEQPLKAVDALKNISVLHGSHGGITATKQVQTEILGRIKQVVKTIQKDVKKQKSGVDGVDTVVKLDVLAQNVLKDFTISEKDKINKCAKDAIEKIACDYLKTSEKAELLKKVRANEFSKLINDHLELLLDDDTINLDDLDSDTLDIKLSEDSNQKSPKKVEKIQSLSIVEQANELLVKGFSKVTARKDIKEDGSEKGEREALAHAIKVVQDVKSLYTKFKPTQNVSPTVAKRNEATDAKCIKKLDDLKVTIEKNVKRIDKSNGLKAIDKAIVEIAKSALNASERKEVFLMSRNGQLSKSTRENLGPVLFKQYNASGGYPTELSQPAFNSLRSTEEICDDVLTEIERRLKTEWNSDTITLLNNIKARYIKHKASLKADPNNKASSGERAKAQKILNLNAFHEKIKGREGKDLLKEAMSAKDYKRYQKSLISKKATDKVDLDILIGEGASWFLFFKEMDITVDPNSGQCNEYDTIKQTCDDLGLVVKQSGMLSVDDLEGLRNEILKNIFEKFYVNPDYQVLENESSKVLLKKYYKEFCPKGFAKWMSLTMKERKDELDKAEKALATGSKVRIPEWHHCTPSATAFTSICKTNVKPSHAPYGSGAFASNTIEMPSYGNWGFAFDAASVVGNVPVNAFKKGHGAFWVGYSEALKVPVQDQKGTITGLDVAYVIVNDKDYSQQSEATTSSGVFNQAAFSVQQQGTQDIPEHEKQTVKGVRKMLAKEGISGVTVVTLDEAMLEKNLIFGKVCQTPIWEPGYGEKLDTDMNDSSKHPELYDINRQKYPNNVRWG